MVYGLGDEGGGLVDEFGGQTALARGFGLGKAGVGGQVGGLVEGVVQQLDVAGGVLALGREVMAALAIFVGAAIGASLAHDQNPDV